MKSFKATYILYLWPRLVNRAGAPAGANWYNTRVKFKAAALNPLLQALLAAACAGSARAVTGEDPFCRDLKKPFFSVACDGAGACSAAPARSPSSARQFSVPKRPGTRRVFIVGESAATLLASGSSPLDGVPGLETVNCGMGGYDSRMISSVFSEALDHEPDLLVLFSGNNEGGGPDCPGPLEDLRRRAGRLEERYYALRYGQARGRLEASLARHGRRLRAMAGEARRRKAPLILCTLPSNLADMPPSRYPPEADRDLALGLLAAERKDPAGAAELFRASAGKSPQEPFALFHLGRSLAAQGRAAEAAEYLSEAVSLDPSLDRATAAHNRLIRETAAAAGAGLCDLEAAFSRLAPGGMTGFEQFADTVHWRRQYNGVVWGEILEAAGRLGVVGLPSAKPPAAPQPGLSDREAFTTFSYSVSYLDAEFSPGGRLLPQGEDGGDLHERSLAAMEFLEKKRPGWLVRAASSAAAFDRLFLRNFWSGGTASRLEALRPVYLAHLAELARRRGDNGAALSLADMSLARQPRRSFARLVRARALLGLGRKAEGGAELSGLFEDRYIGRRARLAASLHGLPVQTGGGGPAAGRHGAAAPAAGVSPFRRARSKRLSDSAVESLKAGDKAGALPLLVKAAAINPANAEAQLTLCSLLYSGGDLAGASEACGLAAAGAAHYPPAAAGAIRTEAHYYRAKALAGLGEKDAAAEELRALLLEAPADWPGRAAAEAELAGLRGR